MSTVHLVDAQLAPLVGLFPEIDLSLPQLPHARADSDARASLLPPPPLEPVQYFAAGRHGGPDVPVRWW